MLRPAPPAMRAVSDIDIHDRIHDLRNLFAVVSSGAHLLQDEPMADDQAKLLHAIDRAAASGAEIAQGLLIDTPETNARRRRDVNSVVADLEPVLAVMLGAGARLSLDLCADPLPLALDERELESALIELTFNAARALGGRGQIVLRSRRIGGRVWLLVADTGRGLARADWPRLTVADGRRGGLPRITRWLRRAHGRLHWRSIAGTGTVVAIDMPLRMTLRDRERGDHGSAAAGARHASHSVAA